MRKITTILLVLSFIILSIAISQTVDFTSKQAITSESTLSTQSLKIQHSLTENISYSQSIGISTKISGFWDLQSNGGAINYIEMNPANPDNIHIAMMVSIDSVDPVAVSMSRRVFYNFSYDGGNSWGNPVNVPNIRSGFPSLALALDEYSDIIAAVASHGAPSSGLPLQSSVYLDNYEGGKNFVSYPTPLHLPGSDDIAWSQITQTTNRNIILAGSFPPTSSLGGLSVITFDENREWSSWQRFETSSKHAGRIAIASGDNGRAAIVWRASTDPDSLIYRQTIDNGASWGPKIVIARENGTVGPCWTGFDAIYLGTTLYVTYTTSAYDVSGYKLANQVMVWKSDTQTSSVVIDSFYFPKLMKSTGSGRVQNNHNFAFNFPSIGKNSTDTRLYIAVDAFQQDVTDFEGFNYSDILLTYSDNFGTSWKIPHNISQTNDIDERYVSLSTVNPILNVNGNDSNWVYLVFQEDNIPGANYVATSSQPEARPISRSKLKFLKFNTDFKERTSININVDNLWNMISIPIDSSGEKIDFFPTATSSAFTIVPGSGYAIKTTLDPGVGYWLKFNTNQQLNFAGTALSNKIIPVTTGWNMIGTIENPLPTSQIITNPDKIIISKLYSYKSGYSVADTLYPGKGYWIKVSQPGLLILNNP
jgi:hypothetical protein